MCSGGATTGSRVMTSGCTGSGVHPTGSGVTATAGSGVTISGSTGACANTVGSSENKQRLHGCGRFGRGFRRNDRGLRRGSYDDRLRPRVWVWEGLGNCNYRGLMCGGHRSYGSASNNHGFYRLWRFKLGFRRYDQGLSCSIKFGSCNYRWLRFWIRLSCCRHWGSDVAKTRRSGVATTEGSGAADTVVSDVVNTNGRYTYGRFRH